MGNVAQKVRHNKRALRAFLARVRKKPGQSKLLRLLRSVGSSSSAPTVWSSTSNTSVILPVFSRFNAGQSVVPFFPQSEKKEEEKRCKELQLVQCFLPLVD